MGGDDNRRMSPNIAMPSPATPAEIAALNGQVRLDDWGLIRAQGQDAASFLQGQLTQDVASLTPGVARLAGYCSAKGRLLASFVVWRDTAAADTPDTFWLACSADLLTATLKRLSMFVLRAKCKLSDASAEFALVGVAGMESVAALGAGVPAAPWATAANAAGRLICLPNVAGLPRVVLVQAADAAPLALPALAPDDWAWLEVRSGVARIVAATVDQFVPQMVNLEVVGGVNFGKGCYPGQEVVARSQYRGTLKRRAMLFDADATLSPGQEVFHSADPGQPAGMVVIAAQRGNGSASALVEVKLAALAAGSLHAGAVDGPLLTPVALPYALPSDAG